MLDGFIQIPIEFETDTYTNVFSQKNNKTLGETFQHRRYASVARKLSGVYQANLNRALGEFLLNLKRNGDLNYLHFLNKNGDLAYCRFRLSRSSDATRKGVYCFSVDEQIKYIGRCRDTLKKRIDYGYGRIHPKNCFIDGQSTNCHLNAKIAAFGERVSLWLREIDDDALIISTERSLIDELLPEWNVQKAI